VSCADWPKTSTSYPAVYVYGLLCVSSDIYLVAVLCVWFVTLLITLTFYFFL
jgi:hypothetical protein